MITKFLEILDSTASENMKVNYSTQMTCNGSWKNIFHLHKSLHSVWENKNFVN